MIGYDRTCPFENVILSKFIFENDKNMTVVMNSDHSKDYYIQTNPINHHEDINIYQFDESKFASCIILFQDLNEDILNKILKCIRELLEMLNVESKVLNAITYVLSETHDNIIQHSFADKVWIQFKINAKIGFFEYCILDNGIEFLSSYSRNEFDEIKTDLDAMKSALSGKSVKPMDGGRGYGIRTSRALLHDKEGINWGDHLIWSGQAIGYFDRELQKDQILYFPDSELNLELKGTLYRLFFTLDNPHFNLYNFLER